MLRSIETLAVVIYRWRALLWAIGLAAGATVIAGMIRSRDSEGMILIGLLGGLWTGFFLAFAYSFARKPPAVTPSDGFWLRLKARVLRNSYFALVAAFAVVALMLGWLTLRALSL